MKWGFWLFLPLALCSSCRDSPQPGLVDADNPLDAAASDANLIVDPASTSPVGLYERTHVAGTDGICISDTADMRFGLVMHFGPTLVCEGTGSARHDGDAISLDFSEADCAIDAAYDGQSIRIPGVIPAGCSALCGPRASMSGGAMARVGWGEGDARRLHSSRDVLRGRAARRLCE